MKGLLRLCCAMSRHQGGGFAPLTFPDNCEAMERLGT